MALISGLGRPLAFERMAAAVAARTGMRIARTVRVGDHAPLEPELRKLVARLDGLECSHVITTEKDVLRLSSAATWNEPLLVLEQRLEIPELQRLVATLVPDSYFSSAKSAKLTDSDVRR